MLEQIRIVLVNTSHTGNIGSAARAMKTMGLTELWLVDPVGAIDEQAIALSAGAHDVLERARIVDTLEEAVADCGLVIGTSARSRTLAWPMLDARQAGEQALQEAPQHKVALVFGRERTGLSNDELHLCQFHVAIPANPDYSSLNLAMAVQTLSYEVRMAWLAATTSATEPEREYPLAADLERFYQHLEETLLESGFIIKAHPGQIMTKLRRFFNRARPEEQELNIWRGILTSIQRKQRFPEENS
ncbi:tRNA (cytosine(32)/uridine(32)-2'-O)-methyltransferase TrmJ [Oceanisphaera avium]|uniref:tRNA (cytidine/uridine-2'-O-)-methyltransferase TrmJ n=1 Tax=Oceanisphaera avium TaxID=1903694 RepID=A0A1Y0CV32_9GAMM|nr:tRNA (cytosine(32)/uridine(32)-2'-O)-methyltransferase TrmJ [Oceanisphaera avium]ART78745.1 tRNA (cytosine(32)/uridine(32)-2'-O)-methyltransferase TrmJ [Oceanisphaera avium]